MHTIKQKKILLVGYDKEAELLFRLSLGELTEHFTYYAASSEKNALAYLQEHGADLIITDINSKTDDNSKAITKIQKKYDIPVLILSSTETSKIHLLKQPYVIGYIYKGNCYITWSMRLRKMLLFFLEYRTK